MNWIEKVKNAFNAFNKRAPTSDTYDDSQGYVSTFRPYHTRLTYSTEKSIKSAIYNRIATDVSQIKIEVCKVNEDGKFIEHVNSSSLNTILNNQANIDQTSRAFMIDAVTRLLDEGCIALCPVDSKKPFGKGNIYDTDIESMRVGRITMWKTHYVIVDLYDDRTGVRRETEYRKEEIAIVENPFYTIMNEPSSTLQRLTRKLNMLDVVDEQTSSGKLDIIIQLPYAAKSDIRMAQAEKRRAAIEEQLTNSKYGIAYIDGTEHITQLNRPAENNLMTQVEYLTNLLFSQLGITQSILEGTADEQTMNNYYERTIEPIVAAIVSELDRKFISETSRTQGRRIKSFNDPFRFVPTSKLPELASKLISNEILTKNEFRAIIGYKPSDDPSANELKNPNINQNNDDYLDENFDEYDINDVDDMEVIE